MVNKAYEKSLLKVKENYLYKMTGIVKIIMDVYVRRETYYYIPPGLSVYFIQNLVLINERLSGGNWFYFNFISPVHAEAQELRLS